MNRIAFAVLYGLFVQMGRAGRPRQEFFHRGQGIGGPQALQQPPFVKLAAIVSIVAASSSASASASAFWGNGTNMGDMMNDFFGDGNGDFNMDMSARGNGHGWGRGYDRFAYQDYGYP